MILLGSAILMIWNLGRTGSFEFYGAAARSMGTSWRAFFYGAYDPAATVTLDKLSGFLVPQALSVRLFGFSWAALALPQVLEGLLTIWCCGVIALRQSGPRAGLFAAVASGSMPIFVSMFGRPMEDGMLTMALALALMWWQRAVISGAVWPLLVAGLFVGVGFQAKMLQAWLIVPALLIALLPVYRRPRAWLWRGGALLGAVLISSLSWLVLLQLQPASERPWFDGSTDNNIFSTVFVYNGFDRLFPLHIPGRSSNPLTMDTGQLLHSLALSDAVSAQTSPFKLLLPYYTTQVGWLYPLALIGIVAGVVRFVRRSGWSDSQRACFVAVVLWLILVVAVLSRAGLAHTAYVAALGVQLVLLAAVALKEGLRLRDNPSTFARLLLPGMVVVGGVWGLALAALSWLPVSLLILSGALCAAGLVDAVCSLARNRVAPVRGVAAVLMSAGLLAGATTWSLQSIDPARAGSGADAYVGAKAQLALASASSPAAWQPRLPNPVFGGPRLSGPLAEIVSRTRSVHSSVVRPLFAADAERISAPVLQATGFEILTDGGYSGAVPVLQLRRLQLLVHSGELQWLVTFRDPPRPTAVDQLARTGLCRRERTWRPDSHSRVLQHGLSLWHCHLATARPGRINTGRASRQRIERSVEVTAAAALKDASPTKH